MADDVDGSLDEVMTLDISTMTLTGSVVLANNKTITYGTGETIGGNGTDLTVTSGGAINLTAVTDIVVPANVGITFGTGEKIEGDSTDLTVTSGADINLTATADVNIPANIGLTFGDDGEKIEGDGTDLTIAGNIINLTPAVSVNVTAGNVFIGDTSNANMTIGLTINQGANDDEAFALKSSDVAHAITNVAETDTYSYINKAAATAGGVLFDGLSTATEAMIVRGIGVTDDTTHTAAGTGYVTARTYKRNGAGPGVTSPASGANLFVVQNGTATQFIVDADGALYANAGTTTAAVTVYDDYDDVQLLRTFSRAVGNTVENGWDKFIQYNEDTLVELGILGAPLKDKPLYCVTKLQQLQTGAIEQLYTKLQDTLERLALAESKLTALTA